MTNRWQWGYTHYVRKRGIFLHPRSAGNQAEPLLMLTWNDMTTWHISKRYWTICCRS